MKRNTKVILTDVDTLGSHSQSDVDSIIDEQRDAGLTCQVVKLRSSAD